ncbi:MAG: hypothetical protein V1809_00295 [Planctomycetota bacterium]
MKYLRLSLMAFALLDAILLGIFAIHIHRPITKPDFPLWLNGLNIAYPVLLVSLAASAFGLATHRRWGFILSYVQFPFRMIYLVLSFGFLLLIPRLFVKPQMYMPVLIVAMVLECARIVFTAMIHLKMTKRSSRGAQVA